MTHLKIILIAIAAFGAVCAHAEPESWQELTFSYDGDVLQLARATPFPATRKKVKSPCENGALAYLSYEIEWRDAAKRHLLTVPVQLPFGIRVPLPNAEEPNGTSGGIIPKTGYFVVRVPSPNLALQPASIRMTRPRVSLAFQGDGIRTDLPNLPADMSFNLSNAATSVADQVGPLAAGPQGYVKLRDTGPDDNRFVLVVMGDGYTAADLAAGTFSNQVANFLVALKTKPPWDVLWDGMNVYRVDIESNQAGADYEDQGPPTGTLKDTYLNASFWTYGIERLLALDATGSSRAFSAADGYIGAGHWDSVLVLVNSTKYGGAGGIPSVSSVNSAGPEITAHELGHSFAGLADEYHYSDGTTYSGSNPSEPNVDTSSTSPKWSIWINAGTPLPTPDTATYNSTVGTFEGAYYKQYGIYRPWRRCKMNGLNNAFCPVCEEAHLLEFFDIVALTDYEMPGTGGVVNVLDPTNLDVGIIPMTGMTNRWVLNGQPFGSGGPTLTVTTAQLPLPTNTISALVTFNSTSIRSRTVEQVISWTVANRGQTTNATPHWWLVGHGLDIATGDAYEDGDGMQAWQEYIADTNPTNRNDHFHITGYSNIPPSTVCFESSARRLYTLQRTTNLMEGLWDNVPGQALQTGVGGPHFMTDTNVSPIMFYRLKVELP